VLSVEVQCQCVLDRRSVAGEKYARQVRNGARSDCA